MRRSLARHSSHTGSEDYDQVCSVQMDKHGLLQPLVQQQVMLVLVSVV